MSMRDGQIAQWDPMPYEEALRLWGANLLNQRAKESLSSARVSPDEVTVSFEFDEGYACCGGRDPDCYCSYATSPRASVNINGGGWTVSIDADEFDFGRVLREIVEAGGGLISA